MEPVVIALASNERYFPGLYCAVASALSYLDPAREVEVKVLDGGISQRSRDALLRLVAPVSERGRLEFVTADASVFGAATLGPGESHMTYCRILLPRLVSAPRGDLLRLRQFGLPRSSELFDLDGGTQGPCRSS